MLFVSDVVIKCSESGREGDDTYGQTSILFPFEFNIPVFRHEEVFFWGEEVGSCSSFTVLSSFFFCAVMVMSVPLSAPCRKRKPLSSLV